MQSDNLISMRTVFAGLESATPLVYVANPPLGDLSLWTLAATRISRTSSAPPEASCLCVFGTRRET